ncbi:hypothetical protein [Nocardia niigatensis]|uniref:hypothetical protein n=1 Tax=Nocardia niigatensis TaxID=209249 RepID=UPI0002FCB006|nr:hypothetical protein [Nocardia niigatensis]
MTDPETVDEQMVEQLRAENAQLRADLDVAEAKIAILDTANTRFQERNAGLLKQIAAAKTQIANLREQRKELRGKLFDQTVAEANARTADPEVRVGAAE